MKTFLEMMKTMEKVLHVGKIDSKKQDILMLFQKQFTSYNGMQEVPPLPKIDLKKIQQLESLKVRAQGIFDRVTATPIIQECLNDFKFNLSVLDNPEPDAYEDNRGLLSQQVNPTLNSGLFNPTLYPNYTDEDIDACVAHVLAHELGHSVVALHTNSLQSTEIKGGFTSEEKQNPENQKIQRGIEFICDSVGAIACVQAGYPCDRFEAIARFGRIKNPTHTSYKDMCELNRLIQQDFVSRNLQSKITGPYKGKNLVDFKNLQKAY